MPQKIQNSDSTTLARQQKTKIHVWKGESFFLIEIESIIAETLLKLTQFKISTLLVLLIAIN